MNAHPLRIGAVGAGGFGVFALQQFLQRPDVQLVAMAGTHREPALAMARRFGVPDVLEVDALLADPDIDLVYIASPPFLHYPQSRAALEAGKHVICEKPLAMTVSEADELVALAQAKDRLCIANLMQRYNPLFDSVLRLVQSGILGACLHGRFENFASDEGLGREHWFWDRTKSGGIFVEHGVHFFDLFEGWLGPGEVVAAQRGLRPGSGVEEMVQCTVRYASGPLVDFHHSFTQPSVLDRQQCQLVFERGDVTLEEWIPARGRVRGVLDEAQTRTLMEIFPGSRLDVLEVYGGRDRAARGRNKSLDLWQRVDLRTATEPDDKMRRYCRCLGAIFDDQRAWLADRGHARKINERNGRDSVAMAEAATRLADQSR